MAPMVYATPSKIVGKTTDMNCTRVLILVAVKKNVLAKSTWATAHFFALQIVVSHALFAIAPYPAAIATYAHHAHVALLLMKGFGLPNNS
mmetsp:Transcript_26239/g.38800  ORF Transcript_26239/g.38800 Transcript_26239/m.38800 type:complete len:90 (-) Transcript_26239:628-897(-)